METNNKFSERKYYCEKCGLGHNNIVDGKVFRYCNKCDDNINRYLDELRSNIDKLADDQ